METPETEGCLSKEQGIIFDHMESDNNNNYKSKGKYLCTYLDLSVAQVNTIIFSKKITQLFYKIL